jgi:hypothetical protein
VVVDASRWRSARRWLPMDPQRLHTDHVGADVLVVTDGHR